MNLNFNFDKACRDGDVASVKELIKLGVNVKRDDFWIVWVCSFGTIEVFKYLVSINVEIPPILCVKNACYYGQLDILKYLVSLGYDTRFDDDSCFRHACLSGETDIAKYLISLGANPKNRDEICMLYACQKGNKELISYLLSLGLEMKSKYIKEALRRNDIELLKFFVNNGADILKLDHNDLIRQICWYNDRKSHYKLVETVLSFGISSKNMCTSCKIKIYGEKILKFWRKYLLCKKLLIIAEQITPIYYTPGMKGEHNAKQRFNMTRFKRLHNKY